MKTGLAITAIQIDLIGGFAIHHDLRFLPTFLRAQTVRILIHTAA